MKVPVELQGLSTFETMEKPYECMIDKDGSVKETLVSI